MANKELKAKVTLDVASATKKLDALAKHIDNVNKAVNKTSSQAAKMTNALNKTIPKITKAKQATDKWAASANKVNHNFSKSSGVIAGVTKKLKGLASTYLGVMGMKAVVNTSDTITRTKNQLNNMEGGNPERTAQAMDKIYAASQRSRSGYSEMLSDVGKLMTLSADAFQNNEDNAIRFQEIMNKSFKLGNMSAAEQASSMYQLVQALGSGVLQGDELRSVREGAALMYKEIENFAQGVLNTEESLKDLASKGVITSDIVVAAVMNAEETITKKFNNTKMTFMDAWTNIKNVAIKSFEEISSRLESALNSEAGVAIINGIGFAITVVMNTILWLWDTFASFFEWCGANWNWLGRVIVNVLAIVGIVMTALLFPKFVAWIGYILFAIQYYIVLGAQAVLAGLKAAAAWAIANWQLALIILVIAAVVSAVIWMAGSFEQAIGMIVGIIAAAGAFIYNLAVGVINGILQLLWTATEPFIGIIEWMLNACMGGFDTFGGAVANLIGQIISWFLSLGKVVTKIIDAIFGTDWTSGLNALQDTVLAWGKNEKGITISREAPTVASITGDKLPNRIAYDVAYDAGYEIGYNGASWLTDKFSEIGDKLSGKNGIGDLPNPNDPAYSVGGNYDPTGANDDINKALDKIKGDTGDIADSMKLTDEDLEYLRRIAEMEWKKEFTTATVKVDMSNYNTLNSDTDLDGIVTKLSEKLQEELDAVANGVYA